MLCYHVGKGNSCMLSEHILDQCKRTFCLTAQCALEHHQDHDLHLTLSSRSGWGSKY